jgi:pilus assembly protein CpaF
MDTIITLHILQNGHSPRHFEITPGVYSVGSDDDCRLCLPHPDIAGRHAILTVRSDGVWIEDLGSDCGTCVDGTPVTGRSDIAPGTPIQMGPFVLRIGGTPGEAPTPERTEQAPIPSPEPPLQPIQTRPEVEQRRAIKRQIHQELVERLDIKRLSASRIEQNELQVRARDVLEQIIKDVAAKLPAGIDTARLLKEVYDEAIGLGPLEDLLEDEQVTEIMVNGPNMIYVERNGKLILSDQTFMDNASVLAIIERIVAPIGRRIDESQPYVDARLHDGSRVNAIIAPLSLVGPCLTIRKFSKTPFSVQNLIAFGTLSEACATFMDLCVKLRKNVIVSGGTGSGKTTLLNVFSNYLPADERIVTIEDAAELRLRQQHVVRLEARPPNIEGRGAISIRDLVRNALRMRPDRIVVGECRGGEALDMLQAMNTGHDGSLTTVHANTPRDVISRLETMVLMSGMELPVRAIREQIASAIDIICHEMRMSDGSRKVTKVTEVLGLEGDQIVMQDIFEFTQTGVDEEGKVVGHFSPTGAIPTFLEEISARGLKIDRTMFAPVPRQFQS